MEFGFEFWERIDELRNNQSLTIEDLAKAMDMKEQSVKNMRSQCRYPKGPAIDAIARLLGTTSDYLVYGKEDSRKELSSDRQAIQEALDENPKLEKFVLQYIESIRELVK